jgi:hypothetical protein
MTDQELDAAYTAVCRALGEVGEANAQRFLAMLSLALIARCGDGQEVLAVVEQVRARCGDQSSR